MRPSDQLLKSHRKALKPSIGLVLFELLKRIPQIIIAGFQWFVFAVHNVCDVMWPNDPKLSHADRQQPPASTGGVQ